MGATLYSLPRRYPGEQIDASATPHIGAVLPPWAADQDPSGGKDRGKQTDPGDTSTAKIAFHMRTPDQVPNRAAEIGPATVAVIDGRPRKRCFGCAPPRVGGFGLADCHDPDRLEAVFATTVGDPSYRTVKGILASGTETAPATRFRPGRCRGARLSARTTQTGRSVSVVAAMGWG